MHHYEDGLAPGVPPQAAALLDDLPACAREAWGDHWDDQDLLKCDTNRGRRPRRGCSCAFPCWPRQCKRAPPRHWEIRITSANTALPDLPGPELVHDVLLVVGAVVAGEPFVPRGLGALSEALRRRPICFQTFSFATLFHAAAPCFVEFSFHFMMTPPPPL